MRTFIAFTGLLSAALLSLPSLADTAAPKEAPPTSTPPVVFHALPSGHVPGAPPDKARPPAVGAGSKAEGIWTHRMPGSPGAMLFASQAAADESGLFKARVSAPAPAAEDLACVTVESFGREEDPGEPWHPGDRQAAISDPSGSNQPRVQATHAERLTTTPDGKATLAWTDAWVDGITAGAKLIAKGSVPLVQVATGPQNSAVYGAREDGWVHFVVRASQPALDGPMAEMARAIGSQIEARWPSRMRESSSNCGFVRVSLPAGPSAKTTATLGMAIVLPPLREASSDPSDGFAAMRAMRSVRRRPLQIFVSSSQSSSDPEPVVSVAFGWGGPDSSI